MTDQNAAVISCAERLFPLAALYLGSLSGGRAAVTETIAAVRRKSPDAWEDEALPRLLRLCQTRAPEGMDEQDFPDDPALEPLRPLLKLPPGSRCYLALSLCGISPEDAASVRGISPEELTKKTEKAMRQMQFMCSGEPPEPEALREAVRHLPWQNSDTEALLAAVSAGEKDASAEQEPAPIAGEIRRITRQEHGGKTVAIPVWGIALGAACMLLAFGGLLFFALRTPKPLPMQEQEPPAHAEYEPEEIKRFQEYLTIAEAQKKTAEYAGVPESGLLFMNTKLKPDEQPPRCEVTVSGADGRLTEYILDAKTGELLTKQEVPAEKLPNTEKWVPVAEMRQAALRCTGLTDALYLKEKLGSGADGGYYKYELLDANGTVYAMEFDAMSGMLMKYSAEEPAGEEYTNIIPPEFAKQQALNRAAITDASQVIFTKIKQDGGVYLIAFTLDDGTQYMTELNAENGAVNTVDVQPVSADMTDAVGVIEAAKRAEAMAGLTKERPALYTKAKVERSNGAYVYELAFETADYEYEVSVNTETGAIVKYRARGK